MLHIIFIKCKVDVMYFIFIFISPSVPRFSVKKAINQLIKNKRPYWLRVKNKLKFQHLTLIFDIPTLDSALLNVNSRPLAFDL